MARRFFLIDTDADISSGGNFNRRLATNIVATATTGSVTVANLATELGYGFTSLLVPGARGRTSNYTVGISITTGSADIQLSPVLHRVNAGGTRVATFADFTEQTANAGALTFTATNVDLGTFVAANRLEVEYVFRSTRAHGGGGATVVYALNSLDTFVFAPSWGTRAITISTG